MPKRGAFQIVIVFTWGLLASCGGGGGGPSGPPPTVSIVSSVVDVAVGGAVTLTWNSSNASGCTASGGWSGSLAASGSQTITVVGSTSYALSCRGAGGSANAAVAVTAWSAPTPGISVDAANVLPGSSVVATWSSGNASTCNGADALTGSVGTSGSRTVGPVNAATVLSLSCSNPVFSAVTASATVTVSSMLTLNVNVRAQIPGAPIIGANKKNIPDWQHPTTVAVPFVYVELDDANGRAVQSGFADASGTASFSGLDPTQTYTAAIQSRVKATTPVALDFQLLNNRVPLDSSQSLFRARYGVYTATGAGYVPGGKSAEQVVTLTALDGWDNSTNSLVAADRAAGPFVLLANAVLEAQIVSGSVGLVNPHWRPLTILWSVTNKGGLTSPPNNYDEGLVTGSGGFWFNTHMLIDATGAEAQTGPLVAEDNIFLSGDPSFEAMDLSPFVMTHEMGHFVQDLFSTEQSPGGDHTFSDYEDAAAAWIEGNASGIAALVMNTPQERRFITSAGQIIVNIDDISNNTINGNAQKWPVGWYQETTVTNFIWSNYHTLGMTPEQALAPMFTPAWIAGPYQDTIWSYTTLLKQQQPALAGSIDAFAAAHGIVAAGNDEYGSKETNAGNRAVSDVLPPYTAVNIGQTLQICSVGKLLEYNKIGNSRWLRLTGDGAGHTLTIQGPPNSVPALNHDNSNVTAGSSTLTMHVTVPPAGQVFSVGECGVSTGEFAIQTTGCSDPTPPAEQCWNVSWQ
jgi:hypothetical protein